MTTLIETVPDMGQARPLVVDLDNTLVHGDTLVESVLGLATGQPRAFLGALGALRFGRAGFKRHVAGRLSLDFATLPYNEQIIDFIRERRASGGRVFLVTAADQAIADGVAAHLGLFDAALGSDGEHNLKGDNKAAMLVGRFPEGFDYIGDSMADIPVWAAAKQVLVAGDSRAVSRELQRRAMDPVRRFAAPRATARDWAKALRVHQWSKNMLLFVPMLLGQSFDELPVIARVVGGFVAFGLVASAGYLVNDMSDLAADRAHPGKRHRALASGRISVLQAMVVAVLLLVIGLSAAFALRPLFGLTLLGYLALTLLYTAWLKALPIIDVMVIGGLFTVRVFAGLALADEPSSVWLSSFAMVLFTSLALAKRHAELIRASDAGREMVGRGYLATDAPLTVALGISTALTSIVVMLLYMQLDAARSHLYDKLGVLFLIPLVLASWLMRVWMRAHRGVLHDDPVLFALRDRVSILHGVLIGLLWLVAMR